MNNLSDQPAQPGAQQLAPHDVPPPQERKDSDTSIGNSTKDAKPAKRSRICTKCGQSLHGQFVRALDGTFHLECFTCQDCGKVVASKFFPVPETGPGQYPLCETDYFRRLDLLCFACGGALRGSYITALERKYHIEHFTCSVCPTVFGAADSYYEHEGNVYCHFHYSTRFAQKCNGCQTAILKQFVEIFRNGQDQHWHPECYMIHKYWNVRLFTGSQPVEEPRKSLQQNATEEERNRVRQDEERIEEKVLWIWRTLSHYEERSATCISDMLLHVSNGAYVDGVMSAKKFITHVDLLFTAADQLDTLMASRLPKGLSYSREAKLLCKKVVAFFQLLAESQDTGVRRLGVTQELLSLVTGLAHYLKLLIRICLQGSLKFERETASEGGLQQFLNKINSLDVTLEDTLDERQAGGYLTLSADTCPICAKPVEDRCFSHTGKVFHSVCMRCEQCQRDLTQDLDLALWDEREEKLVCRQCAKPDGHAAGGFVPVSRLRQYVHLLRVAHARLLATLRTSGALPHTSDDPNLAQYDSERGHRIAGSQERGPAQAPLLRSESRSKSYAGPASAGAEAGGSYEQTLTNIRRLRSTRMDKAISNTSRRARTSRIIDGPQADQVRPGSAGREDGERRKSGFHIIQDREASTDPISQNAFENADAIRLDDIPRIVAAEQAKDQRPNANRYARGNLIPQEPKPRIQHRREPSGAQELEKLGPEGHRPKKYFSELSALEYFIVRHVAVLSMEPLLDGLFNQEELLDLIEMRKPTFWGKFGKVFQKSDKPGPGTVKGERVKANKKKTGGTFGTPLEQLVEREGAESTDGVGPGALRIPAIVQETVSAMRTMDMSMEGIFRKNGNIRRLKETAEVIDTKGQDAVDLNNETPVQVAALLKKFLRELPDPVMTFKLHRLFIASQKIQDEVQRLRVLHLTCCLLPKSHRDTMEVLFCFLNWAASFSVVDEETGSKMDTHNLATVIAPNILFSNNKTEGMEDSFLAIEAVYSLISHNEEMCEVPEDLQSILNDSSLFSGSADITTKEILKRYGDKARPSQVQTSTASNGAQVAQSAVATPVVSTFRGPTEHGSNDGNSTTLSNRAHPTAAVLTRGEDNPVPRPQQANAPTSIRTVPGPPPSQPLPMQPPPQNGLQHSKESFERVGANGAAHNWE